MASDSLQGKTVVLTALLGALANDCKADGGDAIECPPT